MASIEFSLKHHFVVCISGMFTYYVTSVHVVLLSSIIVMVPSFWFTSICTKVG